MGLFAHCLQKMDTGNLSEEAYEAIMIASERFNHDLTLQFGLLSGHCKDENDFVEQSIQLIDKMIKYDKFDLDEMFYGAPPKTSVFHTTLKGILVNLKELKKTPVEKRTYCR